MPTRLSHCWRRCFQSMAFPKSFVLTMAHNMRVPSLPTSVYLGEYHMKPQVHITHNPMDLPRHALIHQTCTPMSQIQLCQSTSRLTSTPSYTHWHQASISSRAAVPMPTQNNHSGQDMQQQPSAIQVCEINTWSEAAKAQADKCSKTLAPLYAGLPVAMYDALWKIWVPATVIHVLPQNSYQVYISKMVPHTTAHGDTFVNAMSKQLTLSQVAQLPHCRFCLNNAS